MRLGVLALTPLFILVYLGAVSDLAAKEDASTKAAKITELETRQQALGVTSATEVADNNRKFAGLNFGVALSVTVDTGSRDRVDSAAVDNAGIVRVDKKSNVRARVMLESHYFFSYDRVKDTKVLQTAGWGPFLALQPGTDEIIDAIGLGVMFGWRRFGKETQSFNLGIGFVVDPQTKVLGDEFVENQPVPKDSTGAPLPIRYQETDQGGVLVLASFAW